MIHRLTTSISIVAIITFLISLTPQSSINVDHAGGLKTAILQIQKLQSISYNSSNNLSRSFANVISGLHVAAGMNTVIAKTVDLPDSEKSQLIVSVRIPYLLAKGYILVTDNLGRKLPDTLVNKHYSSYTSPPETPPPSVS